MDRLTKLVLHPCRCVYSEQYRTTNLRKNFCGVRFHQRNTRNEGITLAWRNFYFWPIQKIRSQKKVRTNRRYLPGQHFWNSMINIPLGNQCKSQSCHHNFYWFPNGMLIMILPKCCLGSYVPLVLTFFEIEFFDSVKNVISEIARRFVHFYGFWAENESLMSYNYNIWLVSLRDTLVMKPAPGAPVSWGGSFTDDHEWWPYARESPHL